MSAYSDSQGMPQRQIGELMTELGLITAEQLATVLEVQHRSKRPLGQIVVELGFASGAAVAHALAMQSGGALRTEYGFALGVSPELAEPKAGETGVGLPKLRLAPTAVPPIRVETDPAEAPSVEDAAEEAIEQPEAVEAVADDEPAAIQEGPAVDLIDEADETEDSPAEPDNVAVELEEEAEADEPELAENEPLQPEEETVAVEDENPEIEAAEAAAVEPEERVEAPDTSELDELRSEVERLQTTLAESVDAAKAEAAGLAHLPEEVERLERTLAEARVAHEEELVSLRETYSQAATELERLQTVLADEEKHHADERRDLTDQSERLQKELEATRERLGALESAAEEGERLRGEVERLENALGEAHGTREEELTRVREEQQRASSELEQVRAALDEAQERHSAELAGLSAQRDGLQHELGSTLERLVDLGEADDDRARLRAELDQLQSTLAEEQEGRAAEVAEVSAQREALREELGSTLERLAELGPAADERDRLRDELAQLRSTLAEEQEGRAAEVAEVSAQREALREELGSTLERLAELGPAADERDRLRGELEQVRAALTEVQESCAVEVRRVIEERDSLTAELEEARELLRQAERVRESQIALTAERDCAVAEAERLQALASEAQAAAEQASRLLGEEQDGRHAERETAITQRRVLEQELGDALERLAAANAAAGEREKELQVGSERLFEALNAVRELAADLVPGSDPPAQEAVPVEDPVPVEDAAREAEAEAQADSSEPETEPEADGYSLFVPGPNGYELIPQTGVAPQAGEIVELVRPDRDEVTVYEVARSSRTLPDGDICVYLSPR
jgi:DNA repair exonuclease SbcCD ATPase subunit